MFDTVGVAAVAAVSPSGILVRGGRWFYINLHLDREEIIILNKNKTMSVGIDTKYCR